MARGRMLSKSFSTSRKRARVFELLGALAEFALALYPLLVAHADDFGRQEGDALTVKARVDPFSPRTVAEFDTALQGLHEAGLIALYEYDERRLLQIEQFEPHQLGLHKRTMAAFPGPDGKFPELPGTSGNSPEVAGNSRLARARGTEQNRTEQKGTEQKGTEPRTRGAPLLRGPNPSMAFTGPRVSVPQSLHRQLVGLRNGNEMELLAWYERVSDEWAFGERKGDEPGADVFKFWRDRYDEEWPATPKAKTTGRQRPKWASPLK